MTKSIFDGLEEKDRNKIIKNLDAEVVVYEKGRAILSNNSQDKVIGIILSGSANIEKYDYNGNRIIIERLEKNSVFSDLFLYIKSDISLVAKTKCEVMLFEYKNLLKNLKNNILVNNILNLYTVKIINLNTKLELISKRTIKDKLLTYFKILSRKKHSKTFNIPFSYTELADYLGVDRSAMMREIKKLKEKGIIKTNKRVIKLIKN